MLEPSLRLIDAHADLIHTNPIAFRNAKIVCSFGLSECTRVKGRVL